MNTEGLLVKEHKSEDMYQISATGDLIITNAKGLQRHIDQAINEGFYDITLNLTGIDYIDSFGIGVVVKTKSEIDKKKGRLRVIVNPVLMTLFEKCHLDDYIDLDLGDTDSEDNE